MCGGYALGMRVRGVLTGRLLAGLLLLAMCVPGWGQTGSSSGPEAVSTVPGVSAGTEGTSCDGAVILKAGRTGPCTALARQVAAMMAEPAVSRAHWGVVVEGMDGTPILSVNGGQFFQPASNTKLFTTAAAMALLGGDATFKTGISGYGVWDGAAKLTGDLTIFGNGDPFLSGREVPYVSPMERATRRASGVADLPKPDPLRHLAAMADQVAATGLKEIDGDIVGTERWEPYPPDWSIEDTTWYYGAPISSLTINDNQLDVVVTPGREMGERPSVVVTPAEPAYYTVDVSDLRMGVAKSGSHVGWDLPPGSRTLRLHGSIAMDAPPDAEGIAIHEPALYAAMALKGMLEARGVRVSGEARVGSHPRADTADFSATVKASENALEKMWREKGAFGSLGDSISSGGKTNRLLATHRSPTLAEDVMVTNKVSQNLHAELMVDHLAAVTPLTMLPWGLGSSTATGVGVVRAFLTVKAGLDPEDFVFYDGSGLSGHDLVTPRATVRLLEYASGQPWFAQWKASLPVGGVDGGLAGRFTGPGVKGRVWAKTGTLGEARALSGYLQGASGRTVVFSVMVSSHAPGGTADREVMDRIVAAVAAAE